MRSESKRWKLVKNREVLDITSNEVKCEDCDSAIKNQTDWVAFQVKKPVEKTEFKDRVFYEYKTIVEFYCSDCAIEEKKEDTTLQLEPTNQTNTFEEKKETQTKDRETQSQDETQTVLVNEEESQKLEQEESNQKVEEKVETWNFETG